MPLLVVGALAVFTGCGGSSPTAPDAQDHWMLGPWEGTVSGLDGTLRVEILVADGLIADGTAVFNNVREPAPGGIAIRLDRNVAPTGATFRIDFPVPGPEPCTLFAVIDARAEITSATFTAGLADALCEGAPGNAGMISLKKKKE